MSTKKTIRAWKDPEYRASLSAEELAAMPSNPAGAIELTDAELGEVAGALEAKKSAWCTVAPKTSVASGCTVTVTYYDCPKKIAIY
jgi:mersacidin/lichenicidin family type 2 lantibiotic